MNILSPDQATAERQLRSLLDAIRTLETLGSQHELEIADELRHTAEQVGKPLPRDLVNDLLREYSGPALLMR